MTASELIAFEADIAERFNRGEIRAPIHLHGGCEEQLIKIFRTIAREDWVCSNWRSHYHALLHGIPADLVRAEIMAGRSMTLCFPEYRMISSAIVGGILPIATGIAWEIKRQRGTNKVWAFMGDMTSLTGIASECARYARGFDLPIRFIVEWNGKSVCTDTMSAWGNDEDKIDGLPNSYTFRYENPWPHSGAGRRISF